MTLKAYRIIGKYPNAGNHPAGTICYHQIKYDYGLASDDERATGFPHYTMTLNSDGDYPGFTIRADDIEEL